MSSTVLKPYVHYPTNYDLSEFKAVAFKRSTKLIRTEFPLSLLKVTKVETNVVSIKDNIDEIVSNLHGSSISKKEAMDRISGRFPTLRKSHIENFMKDCILKEKRPGDTKTRLFAKSSALEKYGAKTNLTEKLSLILEEKLDSEKA